MKTMLIVGGCLIVLGVLTLDNSVKVVLNSNSVNKQNSLTETGGK